MVTPLSWPAGATARGRPDFAPAGQVNYWDRSPNSRLLPYVAAGVAPHGATQRQTMLPGAGTMGMVELIHLHVRRASAATTVGPVRAWARLDADGRTDIPIATARLETNGVGDHQSVDIPAGLLLIGLDQLELVTQDDSVGGTVDYELSVKYTEFQA